MSKLPAIPSETIPKPLNEVERLREMRQLDFLSDPQMEAEHRVGLDRICAIARSLLGVDAAMVSLVFEDDQRFIARANIQEAGTPREIAFCAHTIMGHEPLVVADATLDSRFAQNPLVAGPTSVRFYAGVPLEWKPGIQVGTLCVISTKAKEANEEQVAHLQLLAGLVLDHLRLLVSLRDLRTREMPTSWIAPAEVAILDAPCEPVDDPT
jgi:GAF domain-containing protein